MKPSVTVITPTVAGREKLLQECKESVAAQTVAVTHQIRHDEDRSGPQRIRNELLRGVTTEWVLPVDDDDLIDPDLVETLLRFSENADIVYSWCRMTGRTDGWSPNKLFSATELHRQNFIPVTALVRMETMDLLGGYKNVPMEDHDLWRRAELHNCRFKCVPEVKWTYRFHDSNTYQYQR